MGVAASAMSPPWRVPGRGFPCRAGAARARQESRLRVYSQGPCRRRVPHSEPPVSRDHDSGGPDVAGRLRRPRPGRRPRLGRRAPARSRPVERMTRAPGHAGWTRWTRAGRPRGSLHGRDAHRARGRRPGVRGSAPPIGATAVRPPRRLAGWDARAARREAGPAGRARPGRHPPRPGRLRSGAARPLTWFPPGVSTLSRIPTPAATGEVPTALPPALRSPRSPDLRAAAPRPCGSGP